MKKKFTALDWIVVAAFVYVLMVAVGVDLPGGDALNCRDVGPTGIVDEHC